MSGPAAVPAGAEVSAAPPPPRPAGVPFWGGGGVGDVPRGSPHPPGDVPRGVPALPGTPWKGVSPSPRDVIRAAPSTR